MKRVALVVGLLGVLLATGFAQQNFLQTKIPFEFVAGGRTFPAGTYAFKVSNGLVEVKDDATGKIVAQLVPMTRIAVDKTATGAARISFDVQDGRHFIEAIWPGREDGYLLHTVKGQHTHEIVRSE